MNISDISLCYECGERHANRQSDLPSTCGFCLIRTTANPNRYYELRDCGEIDQSDLDRAIRKRYRKRV